MSAEAERRPFATRPVDASAVMIASSIGIDPTFSSVVSGG